MTRKLYTTPFCAFCSRVKDELDRLGLDYDEVSVPLSRAQRHEVFALSGQRQVPVLVDGDAVIHDSARIVAHLKQAHARTIR